MPREEDRLSKHARELVHTLVKSDVLTPEQARKVERLLADGKQEKAGKLLGKYMNPKDGTASKKNQPDD